MTRRPTPRVLAIASGGGHWVQLLRLRPAFDGADVHFASTERDCAAAVAPAPFHRFPDANRDTKLRLIWSALVIFWIVLRLRPDVVVSTGAAGGFLAIRFAQMFGGGGHVHRQHRQCRTVVDGRAPVAWPRRPHAQPMAGGGPGHRRRLSWVRAMTGTPRILVTVGTQLPFDRLLRAVLDWQDRHPEAQITYQTGKTELQPDAFGAAQAAAAFDRGTFDGMFAKADLVVGHAGMGTIIAAAELGKPILILPRRAAMGEHRNDHQLATAAKMEAMGHVICAWTEDDVAPALDGWLSGRNAGHDQSGTLGRDAQPELIEAVRGFIFGDRT